MFGGKKHKAEIEALENRIVEAGINSAREATEVVSNSSEKIANTLRKSLTNLNFCMDMHPEEHRFVANFLSQLPSFFKHESYLASGIEGGGVKPIVALTKKQREFFNAEYDLRIYPHDGTDHLSKIMEGNIESTTALFNKIMQRYIIDNCGKKVTEYHEKITQANTAFDNFVEFINQSSIDSHNRFAFIEGGTEQDRNTIIDKFILESKKKCGELIGYVDATKGNAKVQPCEVMRDLEDKDVLFIRNPNAISNLSELIEDIENAATHVLVLLCDAYDLKDREVQRYRINKEDEGIFDVWKFLP